MKRDDNMARSERHPGDRRKHAAQKDRCFPGGLPACLSANPNSLLMQWYYAIDGQRLGPVSDDDLARLVKAGTVTDEVLVWHEGLANWQPWSEVAPTVKLPSVGDGAPPLVVPTVEEEGAGASDSEIDADTLMAGLEEHGYSTSLGGCMSRAWGVYKGAFGACLGMVLLANLIILVAGMIPFVGLFSTVLVAPQMTAGMMWYLLQHARGQSPTFDDLFAGFSQRFGPLALVGLIQLGVMFVVGLGFAMVGGAMGVVFDYSSGDVPPAAIGSIVTLMVVGAVLLLFVFYRFVLVHLLIMDLNVGPIEGLKLSWRIVSKRFWVYVGLLIVLLLASLAGAMALLIGLIFVLPLTPAFFAQAYEDAVQSAKGTPPE